MAGKDIAEKTLESYNDVFSDIINVLLFNGNRKVMEDELEQAVARSSYKADRKLREQERDTAKYWRKYNIRISLFGLENETVQEDDMPFRIIGYDGAAYRDQISYELDENGKRKKNIIPRYPVVTLVLYFGLTRWKKTKSIYEVLGNSLENDMRQFVPDYPINLFEIAYLEDEQVEMFKSDFRIVADYFVQMRKNNEYVPTETQIRHVREVLQLMSILTDDRRFEESVNSVGKGAEPKNMCEVLDRVEKRGLNRGIEIGKSEGIEIGKSEGINEGIEIGKNEGIKIGENLGKIEGAKETAIRMKKDGLTIEKISMYVNIDIETIKEWVE